MLMNASLEEKFSFTISFSRPVSLGTLAGWKQVEEGEREKRREERGGKVTGV